MEQTFENWTDYDNWLIQNYDQYSVYKIEETDGKVHITYCAKADFAAIRDQNYKKPERKL